MANKTSSKKTIIILLTVVFLIISIVTSAIIYLNARNNAKENLYFAILCDDPKDVDAILDKYPSLVHAEKINFFKYFFSFSNSNSRPLLYAVDYGSLETVKTLVEHGAIVDLGFRRLPLIEAIKKNRFDIAWFLIESGADISETDSTEWEENVLFSLVSHKIESKDDYEIEQESFQLFKYVIEQGIPLAPPVGGSYGIHNILGYAAYNNHSLAVKYLLDESIIDIDSNDDYLNRTPLICAVENQSYDTCIILLDYGADRTLKDVNGKKALDYAIELNDEKLIEMLSE